MQNSFSPLCTQACDIQLAEHRVGRLSRCSQGLGAGLCNRTSLHALLSHALGLYFLAHVRLARNQADAGEHVILARIACTLFSHSSPVAAQKHKHHTIRPRARWVGHQSAIPAHVMCHRHTVQYHSDHIKARYTRKTIALLYRCIYACHVA